MVAPSDMAPTSARAGKRSLGVVPLFYGRIKQDKSDIAADGIVELPRPHGESQGGRGGGGHGPAAIFPAPFRCKPGPPEPNIFFQKFFKNKLDGAITSRQGELETTARR